jgi:hypothetical protein
LLKKQEIPKKAPFYSSNGIQTGFRVPTHAVLRRGDGLANKPVMGY